jgi:hypothetical protein
VNFVCFQRAAVSAPFDFCYLALFDKTLGSIRLSSISRCATKLSHPFYIILHQSTTHILMSETNQPQEDVSSNLNMRCIVLSTDAGVIIGRKGSHLKKIYEKSGARVVVSERIPGDFERIVNVVGSLDEVSKARLTHFSLHAKRNCVSGSNCAETDSVGTDYFSSRRLGL